MALCIKECILGNSVPIYIVIEYLSLRTSPCRIVKIHILRKFGNFGKIIGVPSHDNPWNGIHHFLHFIIFF